jgi:hypothetical protein
VVTLAGRFTVRLALAGARVNAGIVIESVSGAVLVSLPEVPVIVSGYVPAAAVELMLKVRGTEVELALVAPKVDDTPAGRPESAKVTGLAKPF